VDSLAGRKTHSMDVSNCPTLDVRPESITGNNCTVGNGVNSSRAAWKRLISRASSIDVTTAAGAAGGVVLPSNSDNRRITNTSATVSSEERALLTNSTAPRSPQSKWTSLLTTRVSVSTSAADNKVFDDDEVVDKCRPEKHVTDGLLAETADQLDTSHGHSASSSCADDVISPDDHVTASDVTGWRCELSRQLDGVHERIDDMSQRLEVILQLLSDSPARRGRFTTDHRS